MVRLSILLTLFCAVLEASSVRIYFTANRQGEIEPCGCQTGQIGGLDRLYNFVTGDRKNFKHAPIFVDSGDTFFEFASLLNPHQSEAQKERAKLIAESYRHLGVDLFTPGERDFAAGPKFLQELKTLSKTKFIATNLQVENFPKLFERYALIERGGKRLGFLALADPKAFSKTKGVRVEPSIGALKRWVRVLKKKGVDKIFLLSHHGLATDKDLASSGLVDVIFGAHSMDVLTAPVSVDQTLIAQPDIEGRQLGIFEWDFVKNKPKYGLFELDQKFEKENKISKLMDAYNEKVRVLAFAKARTKPVSDHPFVAHPQQCRTCHQPQYDFWAKTHHSSAYLVLFAKNQHFDPECIECHSLGFNDPAGFSKIAKPIWLTEQMKTKKGEAFVENFMKQVFKSDPGKGALDSRKQPKRYNKLHKRYHQVLDVLENAGKVDKIFIGVQCEHCHGNRHGHPSPNVKTLKKVQAQSCLQCHTPPNDNSFDFKRALPKVACPLIKR